MQARKFVEYLVNKDVKSRPTAQEALAHEWLQVADDPVVDAQDATHVLEHLANFRVTSALQKAAYSYIGS